MAPARPLTVFCHFYNEEFLLPYWLRHHRRLFDHGVLVDRRSTDRSVDIVRQLAPEWELVPSRNPIFDARDCDLEMMQHERRYDGWKLVLNVTEFAFHDDLRGAVERFEAAHPETPAIAIPTVQMVDPPEQVDGPLGDEDLFLQRFHGIVRDRTSYLLRFLHRGADGRYSAGRHTTQMPSVQSDELLVQRFDWSPYRQVRARKLQIGGTIPESDVRQGLSWHHLVTPEELDARFAIYAGGTRDLRADVRYGATLDRLRAVTAKERGGERADPVRVRARAVPAPPVPRRVAIVHVDGIAAQRLAEVVQGDHEVRLATTDAGATADVFAAAEWADVVVAAYDALLVHPALLNGQAAMVVDLAASAPDGDVIPVAVSLPWQQYLQPAVAALPQAALLRGDLFLCGAPEHREGWARRLEAMGRVPSGPDGLASLAGLLETDVSALRRFCAEPRRVTGRLVRDTSLVVSGEIYRQMYTQMLIAQDAAIQLRAAYEALASRPRWLRRLAKFSSAVGRGR